MEIKKNTIELNNSILIYLVLYLKCNKNILLGNNTIKKFKFIKNLNLLFNLYVLTNIYSDDLDKKKILNHYNSFLLKNLTLLAKKHNNPIKTNKTKNRSLVSYSNKKLWKQKGTGRARIGSRKSPLLKGGGVIFGPTGINKIFKINKKLKRKLFLSILIINIKSIYLYNNVNKDFFKNKNNKNILLLLDSQRFKDNKELTKFNNYNNVILKQIRILNTFDIMKSNFIIIKKDDIFTLLNRLIK